MHFFPTVTQPGIECTKSVNMHFLCYALSHIADGICEVTMSLFHPKRSSITNIKLFCQPCGYYRPPQEDQTSLLKLHWGVRLIVSALCLGTFFCNHSLGLLSCFSHSPCSQNPIGA